VESFVLRLSFDDWIIDQINREATRTLMSSLSKHKVNYTDSLAGNSLPFRLPIPRTHKLFSLSVARFLTAGKNKQPIFYLNKRVEIASRPRAILQIELLTNQLL